MQVRVQCHLNATLLLDEPAWIAAGQQDTEVCGYKYGLSCIPVHGGLPSQQSIEKYVKLRREHKFYWIVSVRLISAATINENSEP